MKKLLIFIFIISFYYTGAAFCSDIAAGSQFLRIGQGARTVAMGEAHGGIADDVNAIFYNPAGLVQMSNPEIMFVHSALFEGINMEYLAVGDRITENSAAGAAFFYLYSDSIEKYDRYGQRMGSSYDTNSSVITASYSRKLLDNLNLGINLKRISAALEEEKASTIGADIGGLMRFDKLKTGLSVLNLGGTMEFVNAQESLPMVIKLGASYKVLEELLLALDINLPQDSGVGINIGAEYSKTFIDNLNLSVRGGFKTYSAGNLSLGGGINWSDWDLNFAMVPYADLGSTFRVDLIKRFGAGIGTFRAEPDEDLLEELERLRSELAEMSDLEEELREKDRELERISEEARQREEELEAQIEDAVSEEDRERLQDELEQVRREREQAIDETSAEEERLRELLNQREEELASLREELEGRVEAEAGDREEIQREVQQKEESLEEFRQEYRQQEQVLEERIDAAPSPEEAQRLRNELESLRSEQEQELVAKEQELEELRQESREKEEEINRLREEIEQLEQERGRPPERERGTYEEALRWFRERIKDGPLPGHQKIMILESLIESYEEIEDEVSEMREELEELQAN